MEGEEIRKVIHVDMDAFYASVEQRDNPELRGKPVIVGGSPEGRGVVAAASYEARKFGIRSAMPAKTAVRLCPQAVFVRTRFESYREVSRQIRDIFYDYTDLVEPLSLDEAFLDVTADKKGIGSATLIAEEIRARIKGELNLTASAGVSFNKFLAKVACDFNKPDGIMIVKPNEADAFINALPIRKIPGIGKVTETKMQALGLHTGADMRRWPPEKLVEHFGKSGRYYFNIIRGIDSRRVTPERERKSISIERTFAVDISDTDEMIEKLALQARKLAQSCRDKQIAGRTINLKIRYANFDTITRARTMNYLVDDAQTLLDTARELLLRSDAGDRKVRLLGLGLSGLVDDAADRVYYVQPRLPFMEQGDDYVADSMTG